MKNTIYLLFILIAFLGCTSDENPQKEQPNNDQEPLAIELNGERKKLYDLLMTYRKKKNLNTIPLSKSLNLVAQEHVKDLQNNQPVNGKCNLHSWSNKGPWTPVCYTSDHKEAQKMWNKPRELTDYKGNGYEIAYGTSNFKVTAEYALNAWKNSSGHNNVIIEQNGWKDWNAIGIGVYGGYAVVWFGHEKDNN